MTDLARLRFAIDTNDIRGARRELDRLEDQGRRNERQAKSMGGAFRALGGILATIGIVEATRRFVRMGDEVTQLTGRISLYTDTMGEARDMIAALRNQSTDLGIEFASQAEIVARMAPAMDALNLSQQQLLDLSEGIGIAFTVSGASAQEASAAIIQLSQAFASGELRGEEFRSVNEQGARIMIALENQLGKTRGELREMAEQGQLTADVVANALLAETQTLREELDQMPETVSRASTALTNELTVALSGLNDELKITSGLAGVLRSIANDLQSQREGLRVGDDFETLAAQLETIARAQSDVRRAQIVGDPNQMEGQVRRILGNDRTNEIRESIERGEGFADRYAQSLIAALAVRRLEVTDAISALTEPPADDPVVTLRPASTGAGAGPELPTSGEQIMMRFRNDAEIRRGALEAEGDERERLAELARSQLSYEMELARLRGDDQTVERLSDEIRMRERIAELTALTGNVEAARTQAQAEREAMETARDQGEYREFFRGAFSEGFLAMLDGNGDALSNWWRSHTERALRNVLDSLADEFFNLLSGSGGGNGGGGILASVGGFIGGLFGGNRAGGGHVSAGSSYMVGEGGRAEVFTPYTSGKIGPAGGSGRVVINQTVNVNAVGAVNASEVDRRVRAGVSQAAPLIVQAVEERQAERQWNGA